MSSPDPSLTAWIRAVSVHSPHPGSRRTRPVSFWLQHAGAFLGRSVSASEFRAAAVVAGVRLGPDGESTDLLALETLRRAVVVYPGRYLVNAAGKVEVRP